MTVVAGQVVYRQRSTIPAASLPGGRAHMTPVGAVLRTLRDDGRGRGPRGDADELQRRAAAARALPSERGVHVSPDPAPVRPRRRVRKRP